MDYDGFLNRWLGQAIDWDGVYGAQCVDEVAQYCADNGKPVAYANAKDWFNHPSLAAAFDCIANDPSDPNQLPNRGDIIIWSGDLPGSEGYGHIAIFDMVTGAHSFQSLDQNWGGEYVHFQQHNWGYVLGWLSPKAQPAPSPAPEAAPDPAPANTSNPQEPAPQPAPIETPVPVVEAPVESTPEPVAEPVVLPPTVTVSTPVPPVHVTIPTVVVTRHWYDFILALFKALLNRRQ